MVQWLKGFVALLLATSVSAEVKWESQSHSIFFTYNAVTYGSGRIILIGNDGVVATSTDGKLWNVSRYPKEGQRTSLRAVCTGNGKIIVVGDAGMILSSADGSTWNSFVSNTKCKFTSIVYGNGRFVAVGDSAKCAVILTSADGVAWERLPFSEPDALQSVTWNQTGLFVAVGDHRTILTSPDGIQWTRRISRDSSVNLQTVVNNGEIAVAAGDSISLTSNDGLTWVTRSTPNLGSIQCKNGVFVSMYYKPDGLSFLSTSYKSNDGIQWDSIKVDSQIISSPTWQSEESALFLQDNVSIYATINGADWNRLPAPAYNCLHGFGYTENSSINDIASDGNNYVLATKNMIATTPDFENWKIQKIDKAAFSIAIYERGKFFLFGKKGCIFTSADGITWSDKSIDIGFNFKSVAFGRNIFAAITDSGRIVISPDGEQWSDAGYNDTNKLNSIAFGGNIFVAAGNKRTIITSTDGVSWTKRISPENYNLVKACWNGNEFVVLGATFLEPPPPPETLVWSEVQYMYRSFDGITWVGQKDDFTGGWGGIKDISWCKDFILYLVQEKYTQRIWERSVDFGKSTSLYQLGNKLFNVNNTAIVSYVNSGYFGGQFRGFDLNILNYTETTPIRNNPKLSNKRSSTGLRTASRYSQTIYDLSGRKIPVTALKNPKLDCHRKLIVKDNKAQLIVR
jgi:photosystem II stability/assembly factor-like uncharacterized protein